MIEVYYNNPLLFDLYIYIYKRIVGRKQKQLSK